MPHEDITSHIIYYDPRKGKSHLCTTKEVVTIGARYNRIYNSISPSIQPMWDLAHAHTTLPQSNSIQDIPVSLRIRTCTRLIIFVRFTIQPPPLSWVRPPPPLPLGWPHGHLYLIEVATTTPSPIRGGSATTSLSIFFFLISNKSASTFEKISMCFLKIFL